MQKNYQLWDTPAFPLVYSFRIFPYFMAGIYAFQIHARSCSIEVAGGLCFIKDVQVSIFSMTARVLACLGLRILTQSANHTLV